MINNVCKSMFVRKVNKYKFVVCFFFYILKPKRSLENIAIHHKKF